MFDSAKLHVQSIRLSTTMPISSLCDENKSSVTKFVQMRII